MEERVKDLLQGAIDLHVHCDPSFMYRKGDAISFSDEAIDAGMRAVCFKDHHLPTVQAAWLANAHHKENSLPYDAFGSVVLNHSEGDFNLYVLDMYLRYGAKQVYMPTISDRTPMRPLPGMQKNQNPGAFLPVKVIPPKEKPLHVLDVRGEVKPEVLECMALVRDYDAILSTGHLDYEECYKVVKAAIGIGVKKILLTHFNAPEIVYDASDNKRSLAVMNEIASLSPNIMVELTHTLTVNGAVSKEEQMETIRFYGPERICLGTDCGSRNYPGLVECWKQMLTQLLEAGFTEEEIRRMTRENQRVLLELND
ncbi:MAG: hypothetical protein IKE21_01155 [Erysipelotrichaceae bacterium]|nr:hypothetical protein [Erysipelotrichaceae bacterium]